MARLTRVAQTLWHPRHRWKSLLAGWLAVAGLALWGLYAPDADALGLGFWDKLYLLPDVYSFGLGNDVAAVDAKIQAARFLGPGVAAASFFQASAVLFREQIDDWRLRRLRGHVVVCGSGEKGGRIAVDFCRQGRPTVLVDHDPAARWLAAAKRAGAFVVVGDAADTEVLARAGARRAADLVAITGSDSRNVEITTTVRQVHLRGDRPLQCTVHLLDGELCNLLRLEEVRSVGRGVRTDFMNVFQRGARFWLHEADPFGQELEELPHIVIVGVDELSIEVVVALLQQSAAVEIPFFAPRVTLVAPEASDQLAQLRLDHPHLLRAGELAAIDVDPRRVNDSTRDVLTELFAAGGVTSVFVCEADESVALATALTVQRLLGSRPAPVHVRTDIEGGLAHLLERSSRDGGPTLGGFGLYDRTCTAAAIDGGTAEVLARMIHLDYQRRRRSGTAVDAMGVDWDDLPDEARQSNRSAATQIVTGLASVGCSIVPLYHWDDREFALSEDQIDDLARSEHERWMAERQAAGWQWGAARDDAARRNPLLVAWDELSDTDRLYNREAARALPSLLARAGFAIVVL